jgi:hypothetical protein
MPVLATFRRRAADRLPSRKPGRWTARSIWVNNRRFFLACM